MEGKNEKIEKNVVYLSHNGAFSSGKQTYKCILALWVVQ